MKKGNDLLIRYVMHSCSANEKRTEKIMILKRKSAKTLFTNKITVYNNNNSSNHETRYDFDKS